ncbi:MAG: hypothetical protein ABI556_13890 [Gemmatimonadales bacterium]
MARPFLSPALAARIPAAVLVATLCTLAGCTTDAPLAPPMDARGDAFLRAEPVITSTAATANGRGPQACTPDAKLIGRFAVSTAEVPGTWWQLTKDRFDALGVTDYKAALEGFFGQTYSTQADAIQYLIDGVATFDTNGNGYVCAFEERGTRAHLGVNALYLLGIADDKHFGG